MLNRISLIVFYFYQIVKVLKDWPAVLTWLFVKTLHDVITRCSHIRLVGWINTKLPLLLRQLGKLEWLFRLDGQAWQAVIVGQKVGPSTFEQQGQVVISQQR